MSDSLGGALLGFVVNVDAGKVGVAIIIIWVEKRFDVVPIFVKEFNVKAFGIEVVWMKI